MLEIEFTNNTLVMTDRGVEKLGTLLGRDVHPCLWAIKWSSGMSFHKSHKLARTFAEMQIGCAPEGRARLVDVSQSLLEAVMKEGYVVADIENFSQALTYEVKKPWKH